MNDAIPDRLQLFAANGIVFPSFRLVMDASVNLDNQLLLVAAKIGDVTPNGALPPEL